MSKSTQNPADHTIEMGRVNVLVVTRLTEYGAVLRNHNGDEEVLLPRVYVAEGVGVLSAVEVFVHTDSEDRPVATTLRPVAMRGELAFVDVVAVHPYGAFVDWGLGKDLLVPLAHQKSHLRAGDRILIRVELDAQTGRLYGTQRIGRGLEPARGMVPGQKLDALVIARTPMGYKVVVDHRYEGMLYHNEIFEPVEVGQRRTVYLKRIRPDGKMDCALQPLGKAAKIHKAEQAIRDLMRRSGGTLPLTSKSSPEEIRALLGLSKKQFKAALSRLGLGQ